MHFDVHIFFNKGILYFFQVPMDTPATVNIDMGVRTNVNFFQRIYRSFKEKEVEVFF